MQISSKQDLHCKTHGRTSPKVSWLDSWSAQDPFTLQTSYPTISSLFPWSPIIHWLPQLFFFSEISTQDTCFNSPLQPLRPPPTIGTTASFKPGWQRLNLAWKAKGRKGGVDLEAFLWDLWAFFPLLLLHGRHSAKCFNKLCSRQPYTLDTISFLHFKRTPAQGDAARKQESRDLKAESTLKCLHSRYSVSISWAFKQGPTWEPFWWLARQKGVDPSSDELIASTCQSFISKLFKEGEEEIQASSHELHKSRGWRYSPGNRISGTVGIARWQTLAIPVSTA